ncbi:MAG: energy-coupling factor transporter transmembrane protein EcfT [Duncaniella sp.]|nr:energy-coupling factor transporter transmembrane protein EcfT [Duncaniella sp.]
MSKLENAILTLNRLGSGAVREDGIMHVDGRAALAVTVVYLFGVLSLPLTGPVRLLLFAVYPMVASILAGLSYGLLLLRSLYIVPLVALFAIFNPIYDRVPVEVSGIVISRGWLTFAGVIVRGILAFQALLLLVETEGFAGMCSAMRRLRVPAVLTTQLMMVYRYLTVLLTEALTMQRARRARGYGRESLRIGEWGQFIGQLFIRTVGRSERIHRAMLARGFNGIDLPHFTSATPKWTHTDTLWVGVWCAVICVLRFIDLPKLFNL